MNTEEVKELLKQEDLPFDVFLDWMSGQTVGYKDGVTDFYDDDVHRFLRHAKIKAILREIKDMNESQRVERK